MRPVIFEGSLFNTSQERICDGLTRLDSAGLKVPSVEREGDEVLASSARVRLTIQPLRTSGNFSLEGHFTGSLEEARQWLAGFARHIGRSGISGEFDLWEESYDGWVERSLPLVS